MEESDLTEIIGGVVAFYLGPWSLRFGNANFGKL